ncbi:MAG TPA: hypothetical protein V6C57_24865 [Coleofasciculaceae cyanobacterium]
MMTSPAGEAEAAGEALSAGDDVSVLGLAQAFSSMLVPSVAEP